MASPIPKFPEIIENLKARKFQFKIGLEQLRIEIMRVTGSMNTKPIRNIVQAMSDLGYIKDTGSGGLWFICQNAPYDFPQAKNDSKDLDKYA